MTDEIDKRQSIRRRTIFGGVLFDSSGKKWECSVSDLSETGARIKTKTAELSVGDEIELKINKFNNLRRCKVTWNSGHQFGLEFVTAITENDGEMSKLFDIAHT